MCFYIGIEDLAANSLIELLKKGEKRRFVTYKEMEKYGAKVVEYLDLEKNEKAVLALSRECTEDMFRNYSDYFSEKETSEGLGIELKEDKKIEDLIIRFRGYLMLDVLMAFINEGAISVLGG